MIDVVDISQIDKLTATLGDAPKNAGPKIYKAFTVTSARVKREWQQHLSGTPEVPFGPLTITYDVEASVSGPLAAILTALGVEPNPAPGGIQSGGNHIVSEIGSQTGRKQAPIVTVLEFGAPGQNLPPHGYGAISLQDNADDFEFGLSQAIGRPLDQV